MKYFIAKKKKDFEYIASLYRSENTEYLLNKEMDANNLYKNHKDYKNIYTYIVTHQGENIGWFTFTINDNVADFGMLIDKPFQNYGYGQKSLKALESECRKEGVKKIILFVFAENVIAISIYKKFGYTVVKKSKENILNMEKIIT